jgi:hypothetical protein
MARVTAVKTRQVLLGSGILNPFQTPEHLELFDAEGNPIHLSGLSDLPDGGIAGQVLAKRSDASYDVAWVSRVYQQLEEPDTTEVGTIWIRQEGG